MPWTLQLIQSVSEVQPRFLFYCNVYETEWPSIENKMNFIALMIHMYGSNMVQVSM